MPGRWAAGLLLLMLVGCSGDERPTDEDVPTSSTTSDVRTSSPDSPTPEEAEEAQEAETAPVATQRFDAIAVVGHSGATGVASDPDSPLASIGANSWATGDNPDVDSIYLRLLAERPALEGHNYNLSVNGADIDQMILQALALSEVDGPLPDLVLVQGMDNDMRCDGTDPANARRFARKFDQLLRVIRRNNEDVRIFVVDQWGSPASWAEAVSGVEGQVLSNTGTGECDLFDNRGRVRAAGVRGIQRISRLYYDAMTSVCRRVPGCTTDGNAAQTMPVTLDLLGADYNHLSVAGHAALAEAVWPALPASVRNVRPR